LHIGSEDAEVHAEVASEERQWKEYRRDDGTRAENPPLPTGDQFRVVAESVLRFLPDVFGVLPYPADAVAVTVTVEMLLGARAHARKLV
jgi:hypothetical protein